MSMTTAPRWTRHLVEPHFVRPSHSLVWTPQRVVECAADAFGVVPSVLLGRDRFEPLIHYRMVSYAAVKRFCGLSYLQTAKVFHRDHTSVMHSIHRVESDEYLKGLYGRL